MIVPPYLKKGDKIGIVATARKITEAEVMPAVEKLKEWGLEPVPGKNIFKESNQFAGTDDERASDFQEMLDDYSVRAILCSRGGYGTVRIIDKLNFDNYKKIPKWLIGYSDVTVLHSYFNKILSCETIHATMPLNFPSDGVDNDSLLTLKKVLFGELTEYKIEHDVFNRSGEAMGKLVGGNLSIIYSLRGTFIDVDTFGKILFIEDVDEYLYHIDRMMMNLKICGKLSGLKALIVGGFIDMKDNAVPYGKTAYEIISDAVKEYNYPVCFGFPSGHIQPNNAIILGREVTLKVTGKCSVLSF
ncbi:MAG: LD-carboxypeptidase [Bacteroidia bacterium]|nr:LD-carboxypeptidase [Bacteroidia bacterium]